MSAGNSKSTSQGDPIPYKPPTTTPIKTRVSSQAHLAHTRDSVDPNLRSDLESTLQRVPPAEFLKGLAFDNDNVEEEVKTMCNDIKDDENIRHLLDSIDSARIEIDTYTPFATLCNTITNEFTERFKDLRKRTVKFYGLGRTYLSGPESYHCGVRVGKTGSSRKPDGLGILVKDPEEEFELDRIAREGATKSDRARFEWRTTLLCVEHKLSCSADNDAVPQELQNDVLAGSNSTNGKRKRSTQSESKNGPTNNGTGRSSPPPTKRFRQTPETSKSGKRQSSSHASSSTAMIVPSKWTVDEVQLASYAMETICAVGNRRWVFGLLLDRLEATLWYYDRSGAICTESFNIRRSFPFLARYIIAISTATDEQLGFNTDLQPPPGIEPGSYDYLAPVNLQNWTIRCQDSTNREQLVTYTLLDTIDVRFGIVGRGTVVYTGTQDGTDDEVAIKLSWQVVTRGKEWEWIAAAKKKGCPEEYLVAVHGHGVYRKLSEGFRRHHSKPNGSEDRELRVLVTERVRLLTEISNGRLFLELVRGFVTALYCLDAAGIRHRDISTGNLGYKEINGKLQPKLLDFDHARFTSIPDGPPTSQHLTGTLPFMAIDLLDGIGYMHPLRFDLESLMWCAVWIPTCCHDGKEVCGVRNHPLKGWFSGTNADISAHKSKVLMQAGNLRFQPEFEDIAAEVQNFVEHFFDEYSRKERRRQDYRWDLETSEKIPLITHAALLQALGLESQQISEEEARVEAARHLSIRSGHLYHEVIEEFQPKMLDTNPMQYIGVTDAPYTTPRLAGIPPFMAIDLLLEPGDTHPRALCFDDLESLLWSSLWVAICPGQGKDVRGPMKHPLRKWFSGTNLDVGIHKNWPLMRPGKLRFQPEFEEIEEEFCFVSGGNTSGRSVLLTGVNGIWKPQGEYP
ncbi:hypothetical protein FRB99_004951 [Tulasnella sp. 403]|nr:hypothetical protein FRB99_004951 [Tulasnella sp. 403]